MNHNRNNEQTHGQMVAAAMVFLSVLIFVVIALIMGVPYLLSLFGE